MSEHLKNYHLNRDNSGKSEDPLMDWIYRHSEANAPEVDVEAAWSAMESKISITAPVVVQKHFPLLRVAASLFIVALSISIFFVYQNSQPELIELSSNDQELNVQFPDGSMAIMSEGSFISYPETFGDTRQVQLEGEAFFDIKKSDIPFIIQLKEIDVRVLGTAFNVNAKGDEVRVFVERGLVAFEKGDKNVKISKGQEGIFNKKTFEIQVDSTPKNSKLTKTGEFNFDETPLSVALSEMEKYYEVSFKYSPALKNCRITASFAQAPIDEVIEVLKTILSASITQEKSEVRIKGKGCQ